MERPDGGDQAVEIAHATKAIMDAIHQRAFDRAATLIESARKQFPKTEEHRFIAEAAYLRRRRGDLPEGISLMRQALRQAPTWLPHLCCLADYLIEDGEWCEADAVLDQLIALSEAQHEPYFINDARLRKILCLKKLKREEEIEFQKSQIPPDAFTVIDGQIYRIGELE